MTEKVRVAVTGIEGVADVDDYVDDPQTTVQFRIDRDKAALLGVSIADIADTLRIGMAGTTAGTVHTPNERTPLAITLWLTRPDRFALANLTSLKVRGVAGN